jgi:hypothetical protein
MMDENTLPSHRNREWAALNDVWVEVAKELCGPRWPRGPDDPAGIFARLLDDLVWMANSYATDPEDVRQSLVNMTEQWMSLVKE